MPNFDIPKKPKEETLEEMMERVGKKIPVVPKNHYDSPGIVDTKEEERKRTYDPIIKEEKIRKAKEEARRKRLIREAEKGRLAEARRSGVSDSSEIAGEMFGH